MSIIIIISDIGEHNRSYHHHSIPRESNKKKNSNLNDSGGGSFDDRVGETKEDATLHNHVERTP